MQGPTIYISPGSFGVLPNIVGKPRKSVSSAVDQRVWVGPLDKLAALWEIHPKNRPVLPLQHVLCPLEQILAFILATAG